ncbi:MAG: heparinase, partial [Tannerella sp.]|nr:heparinase [Tannerella sp.]
MENVLVKDRTWVPYPDYADREGWRRLPEAAGRKFVEAGEKYLGYAWPTVRATEYLEFTRTGDRMVMEKPQGERMNALRSLALAELAEGKGRFTDDLVNGVFSFCEQSYWGLSACFYLYHKGSSETGEINLPDVEDPIIDLWVGEAAADLAWIWYFFHAEFDKISPVISKRLRSELQNRVLLPFYERNDYWWITGWGKGWVNNWTPWCNYNVLTCIALLEDDPVKKTEAIYKTMISVDLFFNTCSDDGGCDEGPAYWGLAGGKAFDYLMLLSHLSNGKISLFGHPLIRDIGKYICRAYICDGVYFTNFADAS